MQKILDRKLRRYVVASVDYPVTYLKVNLLRNGGGYEFFKDIDRTTKFTNEEDAGWAIKAYYQETGDNLDLVVVPVDISYELVFE